MVPSTARIGFGRPLHPSPNVKDVQSQGAVSTQRASAATSLGRIPWQLAVICSPSAGNQWSACAQDGASPPPLRNRFAIKHRSVFIRGVPRLAQQGHDLAVAPLPCQVEGRPARKDSQRRIRASFEETLDDREAARVCRVMQS